MAQEVVGSDLKDRQTVGRLHEAQRSPFRIEDRPQWRPRLHSGQRRLAYPEVSRSINEKAAESRQSLHERHILQASPDHLNRLFGKSGSHQALFDRLVSLGTGWRTGRELTAHDRGKRAVGAGGRPGCW